MKNLSNRIYDAFDSVHAERELKEKTKKYLARKSCRRQVRPLRYAAAVFGCLLLLLLGAGGYTMYAAPVAAISIDINPSMEWEVNRFDRVVSVTCYNKEAERTVGRLHLKHRKYDEAISALLIEMERSGYLTEDGMVNISVISEDQNKSTEMQNRAAQCAGQYCSNVSCHAGNSADMAAAHESGLSFGKYQAFLKLQELDPSVTAEDVRGMCMRQIQELIDQYDSEESETTGQTDSEPDRAVEEHNEKGCGWKNGNGQGSGYGNGHGNGPCRQRHRHHGGN